MFAFWSWVAGAVAGCRCRVPLQGGAVRVLFALWSLDNDALQSAAAECCQVLSCPGLLNFPSLFSGPEEPWWVGMPSGLRNRLGLFWLRFFFLMLHLRWCCEQHKQQKQQKQHQQKQQRTSSSTSSKPARAARAACAAAGAACAACAASAARAASAAVAAAAAGSDRRRVAPPVDFRR